MGEQFVNYQVKHDTQTDVANAIQYLSSGKCYVSPPLGGWVSIYHEPSENFYNPNFDRYIFDLACSLSSRLNTTVFAFIVLSGVHCIYIAFDKGNLVDEFYEDPENGCTFGFKKFDKQVSARYMGHPEKIIPYFNSEVKIEQIAEILDKARKRDVQYLGEDVLLNLAPLMEIDEYRVIKGFSYFETELSYPEEDRDVHDTDKFVFLNMSEDWE
jgi:hypothetical protein